MNATQTLSGNERTLKTIATGSGTEAVAGIAAVVLAIIGLANLAPVLVAGVACLAVASAFLLLGLANVARSSGFISGGASAEQFEGGFGSEVFGGLAGIVLAVLSLLNIAPMALLPVSLIVFGAVLLLGGEGSSRFSWTASGQGIEASRFTAFSGFQSGHLLIGIAAIVLGILAVVGIASMVLILVGFLSLGISILLGGSALTARVLSMMQS